MSKKIKIVLLAIGVILLMILLCCISIPLYNAFSPTSLVYKSNSFLSSISQKKYAAAFDLLTFEFKDKVGTPENLPGYIGFTSQIKSFTKYRTLGFDPKTKEIAEIWKINFEDNSIKYLWIVFKDEYHDWRIDRFELRK